MESRVIVKLMGGLGNQMLQFAAGYSLSRDKQATLQLNRDYYRIDSHLKNTHREYELDIFPIDPVFYKSVLANHFLGSLIRKVPVLQKKVLPAFGIQYLTDYDRIETATSPGGTYYLDGYWTNLTWFHRYREELLNVFDFRASIDPGNLELANQLRNEDSVAIHIRRTDYLKEGSIHAVLPAEYYFRAMEVIRSRISNPVFYFFGDDHQWIRDTFPIGEDSFRLIAHNKGKRSYLDMALMTQCRHLVISNSTFSWWGAYLNQLGGIQIAPTDWFRSHGPAHFTYDNFLPKEWLRLTV